MKKIVCLLIVLIALAACKPTAPAVETPPTSLEAAPASEPAAPSAVTPVETPLAPATTESAPSPATKPAAESSPLIESKPVIETKTTETASTTNPKLRDLLKRADEKVSSITYLYGGSETGNLFLDTYQIKGDKMKIKRYEENYYVRDGYYDTIYLPQSIGCCEKLSRCRSHNVDNTNRSFEVDQSALTVPKTPYQWLKEVKDATIVGPETFNERSVTHVKFTNANNQQVDMWIDDMYGLPHKVIVVDKNGNGIKYQFNDMEFNMFKDADFVPPCVKK